LRTALSSQFLIEQHKDAKEMALYASIFLRAFEGKFVNKGHFSFQQEIYHAIES